MTEVAAQSSLVDTQKMGAKEPNQTENKADKNLLTTKATYWDGLFYLATKASAGLIMVVLAMVLFFLAILAWPALTASNLELRLMGRSEAVGLLGFVLPQLFGTVLAATVALAMAVPLAVALALFINFYAPRQIAGLLAGLVDILVAIPSVVYGLWGGIVLLPLLQPVMEFLARYFSFIPLFTGPVSPVGKVIFSASVVLAIMVIPIITAICREVFARTPSLQMEAALALGATRWEMIKTVVLPFGKSGTVAASMIGLGRALGETMAVAMVLSPGATYFFSLFQSSSHSTIAANIALQFPEADRLTASALIFSGLVLFILTLVVNSVARAVLVDKADKKR